jgi:hypothetical protein
MQYLQTKTPITMGVLRSIRPLRIDLEMIDPFKISLDIRDRGWVSEAEPHPHKFDEFNGSFFIWTILT